MLTPELSKLLAFFEWKQSKGISRYSQILHELRFLDKAINKYQELSKYILEVSHDIPYDEDLDIYDVSNEPFKMTVPAGDWCPCCGSYLKEKKSDGI